MAIVIKGENVVLKNKQAFQVAFFRKAGPNAATFRKILDFFPDAGLYIIDAHDRIVAFNHRNCEANNIVSEMDYIGRTCRDIYPKEFAEQYMALVRQVRETGVAVENQVYTHAADHSTDFRIASVYPLRDAHDAIIGTATVWRPVASGDTLPDWYGCLKRVVTFIDKNYARPITLQTLAAEAGMSVTHFRRRFAGILHGGVVEHFPAAHQDSDLKVRKSFFQLFQKQLVQNNFTAVVRDQEEMLRLRALADHGIHRLLILFTDCSIMKRGINAR